MQTDTTHYSQLATHRLQERPFRSVLKERCSENMLQIYTRTLKSKCDFNKVAKQLY